MKKLTALCLAATMILAACSGSASPTPAPGGNTAPTQAPVQSNTKKEVDVMLQYRDEADYQNMEFYKEIEQQTGIHANITAVSGGDWSTKTNLMLASGQYPDIIQRGGVDIEMYGVDQKVLLPLDDYIAQYMPNYRDRLYYDPAMSDLLRASDGKMYRLGWLMPQNINMENHLFVNHVWLENLGLELPTTLQEYEDMLIAFRDGDPNKNGDNKDEIPFTGTLSTVESSFYILGLFGIPFDRSRWVMIDDDGKVTSQLLHENLRPALETMSKWYKEGLMDIESIAQDTTSYDSKVNVGLVGSFFRWRMIAMGTAEDIVEQYTGILPVKPEGITPKFSKYLELPTFGAALTTACDDIETACTWLDAQYEFENQFNAYYGKYQEKTVDGKPTQYGWRFNPEGKVEFFSSDWLAAPGQAAIHFYSGPEYFSIVQMPSQRVEKTELCDIYTKAGNVEKNSGAILTSLCKLTVEEIEKKDKLAAEIDKYADEAFVAFVANGVTDASWNTFTQMLQDLKINDLISLYQGAYDRYLSVSH